MSEKQRVLRAVADGPQHEAEGEVARQPTGIRVDTATESPHSGREPAQSDIQPAGRAAGQAQGVRGSGETSRASFAPREGGLVLHGAVRCGDDGEGGPGDRLIGPGTVCVSAFPTHDLPYSAIG